MYCCNFCGFPGKFHMDGVIVMTTKLQIHSRIANRLFAQDTATNISQALDAMMSQSGGSNLLIQLDAIGQLDRLIHHPSFSLQSLENLLRTLLPVEEFYKEMGGVAGYSEKILSLLKRDQNMAVASHFQYHSPSFIDISKMDAFTQEAIAWGIEALPEMAEMIPLGGAADRLHLVDETTGVELPAAKLKFAGKILLQRLINDIQAREHLYFQIYGKQIVTPIAMMTSFEKNNHDHVIQILEENRWFGRPKESFRIIPQPLVPVVNEKGEWLFTDDLQLVMKPGGHGAIWKLAIDTGIFSWFLSLGRKKALIRQINNPIAGLDHGLLAFLGIGWKKKKKFGFASCPRLLCAAEGVNVLIEKKRKGNDTIVLTNIEYCDFAKFGIEDLPLIEGEPYSRFSSNTNLLFVDLVSIQQAVTESPFPGLLLNLKKGSFMNANGSKEELVLGRLESTMQNIADVFEEEKKETLTPENTFITYNQRHKTISTTKRAFVAGGTLQETPEACFFDFLYAARELLESFCDFTLPQRRSLHEYLEMGPEFVFLYHPALGPLYSIIQRKMQKGNLSIGAELNLEISDLLIDGLSLNGSLRILADRVMGSRDENDRFSYTHELGRCILRNVTVSNQGVDWNQSRPFWKGDFCRLESVEIVLKGNSEFIADGVSFVGSHRFVVEDGVSMRITQLDGRLIVETR